MTQTSIRVVLAVVVALAIAGPMGIARGDACTHETGEDPPIGLDICAGSQGFRYRDDAPSTVYVLCLERPQSEGGNAFIVDLGSGLFHYGTNALPAEVYRACAAAGGVLEVPIKLLFPNQ